MRYIHSVGVHEKFVASGEYTHHHSQWCIHQLPDGAWMMRVDWDKRRVDGTSVLLEAWRSPIAEGGYVERFDMWGFADGRYPIRHIKGRYFVVNNTLEVSLQIEKQPQHIQSHPFSTDMRLVPDMPLFWGYMTAHTTQTIVSCLFDFHSPHGFFPVMLQPTVTSLGETIVSVAQTEHQTHHYQVDNRHIWVDNLGIVLAYEQDGVRCVVKNYARRKHR